MRNLKKVLAVIIVVTMILTTMMVSVFADDTTATTAAPTGAQIVTDLGILKGGADGVDAQYLATPTQRIQAAIIFLRLLGLEDEARAFDGTDNFSDASTVADIPGATNILAYLKANPDLGWVGDGVKFNPTEEVSAQQLYKVFLTVLGYAQGTDFDYDETLYFAKFVGMSDIATSIQVTNADFATALVEVLGASFKGGGPADTLISKLVNDGLITEDAAIAAGFTVSTEKIVSVTAPADITIDNGATLSLPATVSGKLSDNSTIDADVTWDTSKFDATVAGDSTITGTVDGFAAGVSVKVTVKALVFAATAKQLNRKEIEVDFNKAATDVGTKANYTLNNSLTVLNAAASADNKSVILTTTQTMAAQTDTTVTLGTALGFAAATTVTASGIIDGTDPKVVSVTVTGPTSLSVVFSEPIQNAAVGGNFQIDSGATSATYSAISTDLKTVTVNTGTLAAGSHALVVNPGGVGGTTIQDFAGLSVAKATSVAFDYAADTTIPTVSLVSATQNSVTVKFSKAITAATQANVVLYHSYAIAAYAASSYDWATAGDNQTVTATWNTNYLPSGTATIFVQNSTTSATAKDNYSNVFVNTTLTATVTNDTVAPTVTTVAYVDSTHLDVTFSEAVKGIERTDFTLVDSSATAVAITNLVLQTGNTYRLTTATMSGSTYTLSIAASSITDASINANAIAAYSTTLTVSDTVAPTVANVIATVPTGYFSSDMTKAYIYFSEAMATTGAGSILDTNNYRFANSSNANPSALPTATFAVGADGKSVVITFAKAVTAANGYSSNIGAGNFAEIIVGQVKDVAGNVTLALQTPVSMAGTVGLTGSVAFAGGKVTYTGNVSDASLKVTGANTIVFQINKPLSAIDVTKFSVAGLTTGTVTNAVYANASGTATVTLTTNSAINTNVSNLTTISLAPSAITDTDGVTNGAITMDTSNASTRTTIDYVAPALAATNPIVTVDSNGNGYIDRIDVTLTENLYVASVQDSDFTVGGYTINSVGMNGGNVVQLFLKEGACPDTDATPTVTLVGALSDITAQHNTVSALAGVTAVDQAAPVIVSAVVSDAGTLGWGNDSGDILSIAFSEPVKTNFGTTTPTIANLTTYFAISGGAITNGNGATITVNDLSTTAGKVLNLTLSCPTGGLSRNVTTAATVNVGTLPAGMIKDGVNQNAVASTAVAIP